MSNTNNQFSFLDYTGLSLFWSKVKKIIEDNELVTTTALTDLDTRVDNLEDAISDQIISKTYTELKTLRDNGQLVPGQQYRITDYTCTTTQGGTKSAGHVFDIIVTADSENKLNEEAFAIQHEGDTYFSNSKLSAWKIWYCLDNDATRFAWADSTNGKGVIYRMIDEWNNDCPYDFKNMMFKVYYDGDFGAYKVGAEGNSEWSYTFCMLDKYDNKAHDVSVEQYKYMNDEGFYNHTYDNRMLPYYDDYANASGESNVDNGAYKLNANVFVTNTDLCSAEADYSYSEFYAFSNNAFGNDCDSNAFGNGCDSNAFGNGCNSNAFGNSCYNNAFGNYCQSNAFGNGCYNNAFGNYCQSNAFGNNCYNNAFGNGCYNNAFGNNCRNNVFGNGCHNNSFGNNCRNNVFGNSCTETTFGNDCYNNSFGNGCYNNNFGNDCYGNAFGNNCGGNAFGNSCGGNAFGNSCGDNAFGNSCYNNAFGNNCRTNVFGNYCQSNAFGNSCWYDSFRVSASPTAALKDFAYYNHLDDGCSYNVIWNSDTTSSAVLLQNVNVNRGVKGTRSSYNMININTLNQDYEVQVAKNSKGEIKIYCEADLIA